MHAQRCARAGARFETREDRSERRNNGGVRAIDGKLRAILANNFISGSLYFNNRVISRDGERRDAAFEKLKGIDGCLSEPRLGFCLSRRLIDELFSFPKELASRRRRRRVR